MKEGRDWNSLCLTFGSCTNVQHPVVRSSFLFHIAVYMATWEPLPTLKHMLISSHRWVLQLVYFVYVQHRREKRSREGNFLHMVNAILRVYSRGWSWTHNLSVILSQCWAYRCVPPQQGRNFQLGNCAVLLFEFLLDFLYSPEGVLFVVGFGYLLTSSVLSDGRHSDNCCWL